jgi:hypothetical protein
MASTYTPGHVEVQGVAAAGYGWAAGAVSLLVVMGYATVSVEIRGIPPLPEKHRQGWGTRRVIESRQIDADDLICPSHAFQPTFNIWACLKIPQPYPLPR